MVNGIIIDKERLKQVCLTAYEALKQRRKFFNQNWKRFLPQWNTPKGIEETNPLALTQYLYLMACLERRSNSKQNILNGKATWENPKTRWIFNPFKVMEQPLGEIEAITKNSLHYTLHDFHQTWKENATQLVEKYDGDPRKIIQGKTAEEAQKALRTKGVLEIANLMLTYFHDRKLVSPTDPYNLKLKMDIHKTRIPLNTGTVQIKEDRIRRSLLEKPLEKKYSEIIVEEKLHPCTLDSALWIIGSEICTKRDYGICKSLCPLESMCQRNYREYRPTTEFIISPRPQQLDLF